MKKTVFLLFAAFIASASFGQKKTIHDANVEVRNVTGFHAIEVSGGINLYLSSGDEAVAVSAADPEVREQIKTEVKDGILKIYVESKKGLNFSFHGKSARAYVSYRNLEALSASGGSDIMAEGTIKLNQLSLHLSGGCDFNGKVEIADLTIHQSGGSDVHLAGRAANITIDASGGSDFGGYDLAADNCTIHASGGSDVNITVNKEISAEASGASDVSWKGSAMIKKASASGAGSVSHRS